MDIFYYASVVGTESIVWFSCTNSLAEVVAWIDAANLLGGSFELREVAL
jgi:hypothetical protein